MNEIKNRKFLNVRLAAALIAGLAAFYVLTGCGAGNPAQTAAAENKSADEESVATASPAEAAEAEKLPQSEILKDARVGFDELLSDIRQERQDVIDNVDFEEFDSYLQHKSGETDITQEEIEALTTEHTSLAGTMSQSQAEEDVRLFFKAMHYAYGPYYYFGADKFEAAEADVLAQLAGIDGISAAQLAELITDSLDFLVDYHFQINNAQLNSAETDCKYYYTDRIFYRDDAGYYMQADGVKYYYQSCDNGAVSMQRRLLENGDVAYSPVQLAPDTAKHDSDVMICCCDGAEYIFDIKWTAAQNYSNDSFNRPDYSYFSNADIAYISIRMFDNDEEQINQFIQDGSSLSSSKYLIIDARSNGGGQSDYIERWLVSYVGKSGLYNGAFSMWQSALSGMRNVDAISLGKENYIARGNKSNTELVKSNQVIFLLTDGNSGSCGEDIVLNVKGIENAMIIGSMTKGCEISGNAAEVWLPSSGINVRIPGGLKFFDTLTNIDGIGFTPDIWCNPADALDCCLSLIESYELTDKNALTDIRTKLASKPSQVMQDIKQPESSGSSSAITLDDNGIIFGGGSGFGHGMNQSYLTVLLNGQACTDFEVTTDNPSLGTVEKTSDGRILCTPKCFAEQHITVTCGSDTLTVMWNHQ